MRDLLINTNKINKMDTYLSWLSFDLLLVVYEKLECLADKYNYVKVMHNADLYETYIIDTKKDATMIKLYEGYFTQSYSNIQTYENYENVFDMIADYILLDTPSGLSVLHEMYEKYIHTKLDSKPTIQELNNKIRYLFETKLKNIDVKYMVEDSKWLRKEIYRFIDRKDTDFIRILFESYGELKNVLFTNKFNLFWKCIQPHGTNILHYRSRYTHSLIIAVILLDIFGKNCIPKDDFEITFDLAVMYDIFKQSQIEKKIKHFGGKLIIGYS